MKTFFLITAFLSILPLVHAEHQPKGFLVFEIDRYTYNTSDRAKALDVKQSFAIPLTDDFMSNFKRFPDRNSQGTGFNCSGGELKTKHGTTRFMWWIHRTADHHWAVNMWADGAETVNSAQLQSRNPSVSQDMIIKTLEDLDMHYMLSFQNMPVGLNISFAAKYVSAEDMKSLEAMPIPFVQKADGSVLFKGEKVADLPIEIQCGFQEN